MTYKSANEKDVFLNLRRYAVAAADASGHPQGAAQLGRRRGCFRASRYTMSSRAGEHTEHTVAFLKGDMR